MRSSTAIITTAAGLLLLLLGGCGDDDSSTTTPSSTAASSGMVLPGGGLSVAQAISTDAEPPLAVTGWVVRSGDSVRLCSAYDPSGDNPCEEPSLRLVGATSVETGRRASLLGAVEGETFVVAPTTSG